MSIKLKIVSKGSNFTYELVTRDTTIGNTYDAIFLKAGDVGPDRIKAIKDSYAFKDDVGDWVTIWTNDTRYDLV